VVSGVMELRNSVSPPNHHLGSSLHYMLFKNSKSCYKDISLSDNEFTSRIYLKLLQLYKKTIKMRRKIEQTPYKINYNNGK
jgi:hypothetical protein